MRYIALLILLMGLGGCGQSPDTPKSTTYCGEPPIDTWIVMLGNLNLAHRDVAEASLFRCFVDRPDLRWQIGRKCVEALTTAPAFEVQARLNRLLAQMQPLEDLGKTPNSISYSLSPKGHGNFPTIHKLELGTILITDLDMHHFYHALVQKYEGEVFLIPKFDFREKWLFLATRFNIGESHQFKHSCYRDFSREITVCKLELFPVQFGDFGATPAGGVSEVEYALPVADLPFELRTELNGKEKVVVRLSSVNVNWDHLDDYLASHDILACRDLAGVCTPKIPWEKRKKLVEQGFLTDPLLPYVYFQHLARASPQTFIQEYPKWLDKIPQSFLYGRLFGGALQRAKDQLKEFCLKTGDKILEHELDALAEIQLPEDPWPERVEPPA